MDQELSAKIESELQMEKEMRDSEKLPSNISDYLDSSSFEVNESSLWKFSCGLTTASSTTPPGLKKSF